MNHDSIDISFNLKNKTDPSFFISVSTQLIYNFVKQ